MGALCLLAGMIAASSPASSLKKAISLYNNLDDAAASKELHGLLAKRGVSDSLAARAHLYLGLIELNAIHTKEARDEFEKALTLDPVLDLPRRASPKARLAFAEARHELQVEMAQPVQPKPRPKPPSSPGPEPNLEISPNPSYNPEPGAEAAPPPPAAQAPSAPLANPGPPPPPGPMMLIPPPPPPPAGTSLVDEHVKEEPPPPKNHALSITLGALTLVAGGFAITGAVEIGRYNGTLADAKNHPGKYSGATIASKENTAQIWQITAISLAVLSALGVTGTVLTW